MAHGPPLVLKEVVKLPQKKVGLALGSGAARGMAHVGVLTVLQKEDITIDMIAGTSVGAAIGAMYAQGKKVRLIEKLALDLSQMRLTPWTDLTLPRSGIIGGKKLADWFRSVIGHDVRFGDLKTPFACVATDIMTGEEVVISEGSVVEAIRASISIPGIFTVVKREGRYLVDGSLVNPVPVSVLKTMGADLIIAVNVIPDITARDRTRWLEKQRKQEAREPNIFHILMQSIYIGTHSLAKSSLEGADIAIEPRVAHIGPAEIHRAKECIQQGALAAQKAIPEIKRQLAT